jgi:hypothetical protein
LIQFYVIFGYVLIKNVLIKNVLIKKSFNSVVAGDVGIVSTLGPQDDFVAPGIFERAVVATEFFPVVLTPQNGCSKFFGTIE